jgi:hypothetical protein
LSLSDLFVFFSNRKTMKRWVRNAALAALIVAVIFGFIYLVSPNSRNPAKTIQDRDVADDRARFTPAGSIDLSMAMKMVTHDPPQMLAPPEKIPPLLLYPPSASELENLSGK